MKLLQKISLAAILILLAGCMDVKEDVMINSDGTGTYSTKMDMGQLLAMIQTFAGDDTSFKQIADKVVDTTINMASIADSAQDLTPPQKELMKNGTMHMQLNMKEQLFKMDMQFMFKNYIQLKDLMTGFGGKSSGMAEAMKSIFGGSEPDSNALDAPRDPGLDQLNNVYDITVRDGIISKQVDTNKLKALLARPEVQQMQNMSGSGMEMQYTTTFHLPRPAKAVKGEALKLSDDKKTVTLSLNMLDLFDHPERFSYSIEY